LTGRAYHLRKEKITTDNNLTTFTLTRDNLLNGITPETKFKARLTRPVMSARREKLFFALYIAFMIPAGVPPATFGKHDRKIKI